MHGAHSIHGSPVVIGALDLMKSGGQVLVLTSLNNLSCTLSSTTGGGGKGCAGHPGKIKK